MEKLREIPVRKYISAFVLLITMIFIFRQRGVFLSSISCLYGDVIEVMSRADSDRLLQDVTEDPSLQNNNVNYRFAIPPKDPKKRVSMKGDAEVVQEFVAQDSLIKSANIIFYNPTGYTGKGKVEVELADEKGRKLGTASLDTRMIQNDSITVFSFGGDSEAANRNRIVSSILGNGNFRGLKAKKGHRYTITVRSKGVRSSTGDDFAIYLCEYEIKDDLTMTAGGKQLGDNAHAFMAINYNHFSVPIFTVLILFFVLGIVIALMPWEKVEAAVRRRISKDPQAETDADGAEESGEAPSVIECYITRAMFILTPFVIDYFIDKVSGFSMVSTIERLFRFDGFLNLFIIGMVVWGCYALTNRLRPAIILPTLAFFVFAFANYVLIQFRGSPLVATDFAQMGTAMDVAASYQLNLDREGIWLISIAVMWSMTALSFKGHKGLPFRLRVGALAVFALWVGLFYNMFFVSDMLADHNIRVSGFNPNGNYKMHGYTLAMVVTFTASRAEKPEGYTVEAVERITDRYMANISAAEPAKTVSKKTPNFIMVMNEAYSDLRIINDFETNEEFMPYFKSLKENTISGWMHTSIFGGSTANTEFEFLTGFSLAYLPYRTVPYSNMMREETPSLIWNLKSRGYGGNVAFHPGESNSYNRNNVYPELGFEKHIALEDMKNPKKLRDYVSDEADFNTVIETYEEYKKAGGTAPFDLFNVTIQNHSGYSYSTGKIDPVITISDESLRHEQAGQYLNLVRITDTAFRDLVEHFKKVKEPTVIVMFGDHQPRVEDEFYDTLFGTSSPNKEETDRKHQVPFLIWANYDIEEEQDVEISANYLASYMLKKTGGQLSPYNEFLLDMYEKIPVLTTICYFDADGNIHDIDKPDTLQQEIADYQMVEYNGFIDTDNRIDDFFYLDSGKHKK